MLSDRILVLRTNVMPLLVAALMLSASAVLLAAERVLDTSQLKGYVEAFNAQDEEMFSNIKNKDAFEFLEKNIPLFDCPDEDFRRTYYFRWWTFRKHVKLTDDGYVVTEFMPKVGWAGKHNTISCPAGHHFYEGRWLHDQKILDDYASFWLCGGASPRSYSFWIADAYLARNLAHPNPGFLIDLLPDLVKNYEAWEAGRVHGGAHIGLRDNGLFYTICDREGMEVSISGDGFRPTLNSYMYGDAVAIAEIARMAGKEDTAQRFTEKARVLKGLIQTKLWDADEQFFKVLPGERIPPSHSLSSSDKNMPRHTWWAKERLGAEEWVQYEFPQTMELSSVEVLWFADGAGCRVPSKWRLEYHDGMKFLPLDGASAYGVEVNAMNRVSFPPIRTTALRVVVETQSGRSAGILEWNVLDSEQQNVAPLAAASASYTDIYRGTLKALNDGMPGQKPRVPQQQGQKLRDVKELAGLVPWYFNLPDPGFEAGWKELSDPKGFKAPYGPTFAEQRHPRFVISYEGHECQWNGPSWPMATSLVLTGMANLLNNYEQDVVGKQDYFDTLKCYARSHHLKREDGSVVPWIDENLNPFNGDWISRTRLHGWAQSDPDLEKRKGGKHRGKDYNHSSFNDLIITGLVGLRPRADDTVEVHPLLPANTWDYFCLDHVPYHGKNLTIIWDKTGKKYGRGAGLTVLANGKKIAHSASLSRVTGSFRNK